MKLNKLMVFAAVLAVFLYVKPVQAFRITIPTPPDPPHFNFIIPTPPKPPKPPLLPCLPILNCFPIPTGAVSWWKADGSAKDFFNENNGVLNNGVTFASGKIGQAFSFNTNSFVQTGTVGLPIGNSDRTVELWVKIISFLADVPDPHSPLESFFLGYGNFGSGGQAYQLGTAGNVLYFTDWGGAIFGPSLKTGIWYHVAVTNVGNNVTLYLNGSPVSSGTLSMNTPGNSPLYMGRIPGSIGDVRKLNGLIDEVIIYNRALSPSEILARASI